MRLLSIALLSLTFSFSAWGGYNIPKCDQVVFEYLTDTMFIDSVGGIAVVPINKNANSSPTDDIALWDLQSGKLIESVHLSNHQYGNAIKIIGFEDANTVLILTWDQTSAYTGPSLIEYKIKERKENLRWNHSDKGFKVFDISVSAMTALAGVGMYPYDWKVLDLKTGELLTLKDTSVVSSERLVFTRDGKSLFGGITNSANEDWHSFSLNIMRWNPQDLSESNAVVGFNANDFHLATNVERYQNSIRDIQAGIDGKSIYISSQIASSDHSLIQNFLGYVDLNSGKKTTCPYSVNGVIDFEIVNSNENRLLVGDSSLGNYHPVFVNAKTCKVELLPQMDGFSEEKYPSRLRATQVKNRSVLFNHQNVWDAQTGKVLLKMCQ